MAAVGLIVMIGGLDMAGMETCGRRVGVGVTGVKDTCGIPEMTGDLDMAGKETCGKIDGLMVPLPGPAVGDDVALPSAGPDVVGVPVALATVPPVGVGPLTSCVGVALVPVCDEPVGAAVTVGAPVGAAVVGFPSVKEPVHPDMTIDNIASVDTSINFFLNSVNTINTYP